MQECVSCKRKKEIAARGLCRACYQRWYKTGSTEYARWGKRSKCQINGCDGDVVSHGLCDLHRKRLERHGHIEETRPVSWGSIENDPLVNQWRLLRRHKGRHPVVPEWNDFLQFALDIGERPSLKHKLFVADDSKPIGPDNFVWKRSIAEKVEGEDEKTYQARRQRVFRALSPENSRGYTLKCLFGLSRDDYKAMHAKQDGKCAICLREETSSIRGKTISLCVDHCHVTGAVRGLLCTKCNPALGAFDDNIETLRRAIAYLERHQK